MIPILTRGGEVSNMRLDTPRQDSFIRRFQFKTEPPTIREITEQYLRTNGYDGLCNYEDCGCSLGEDFMSCGGEYIEHCQPGHRMPAPADSDYNYLIYLGREGE